MIDTTQINKTMLDSLHEEEFNEIILQFGSFISILKNKKLNQNMLLNLLLENDIYMNCLKKLCEINDNYIIIKGIIAKYPALCRSRVIKVKKIKKVEKNDRRRKKSL